MTSKSDAPTTQKGRKLTTKIKTGRELAIGDDFFGTRATLTHIHTYGT